MTGPWYNHLDVKVHQVSFAGECRYPTLESVVNALRNAAISHEDGLMPKWAETFQVAADILEGHTVKR